MNNLKYYYLTTSEVFLCGNAHLPSHDNYRCQVRCLAEQILLL